MSEQTSDLPPRPAHLCAPWPAHFRLRSDLAEELGAPEAFSRTLPKTPEAYSRWLAFWGRTAQEAPFEPIRHCAGRYELTARYVFHPAVLPGAGRIQNVLTDGHGWSVCCELGGLYDFVIERAAEYAAQFGGTQAEARLPFYPKLDDPCPLGCRHGRWSVGFECATGLATILCRDREQTEARFLAGQGGYDVPDFGARGRPS